MDCKVFCRRVVALSLCFVLVFCQACYPAFAGEVAAASVAVNGAQLITAGLAGQKAVDYIAPKMAPVVGGVLQGCGIKTHVVGETTPSQFVTTKVAQFCGAVGYSLETFWTTIAKGCFIAQSGAIQLSHEASELVSQFGSWLFAKDMVVAPPTSSGSDTSSIGDASISMASSFTFSNTVNGVNVNLIVENASSPVFIEVRYSGGSYDCTIYSWIANTTCSLKVPKISHGYVYYNSINANCSNTRTNQSGKVLYFTSYQAYDFGKAVSTITYEQPYNGYFYNYFSSTVGDVTIGGDVPLPGQDVFTGTPEAWAENKDLLNPGAASDTVTTLDPDVLNPIIDQLQAGHAYDITITSYLDALAKAFDRVEDATVAVRDRVTAIEDAISIPSTATEDLTVSLETTPATITPAVDPESINYGGAIDGVSFDLTQIFPFCIPFDIYDMLATLSASPEAPSYHVHYEGPYNIIIDFTVDLSPWDSVAAVLRTVELLAFCIGLAYVTRSMFIRS